MGNPLFFGETDFTVGFADPVSSSMCNFCGATTAENG